MVKLIERKFTDKRRAEVLRKKKIEFMRYFSKSLPEEMAELFYNEVRQKIRDGKNDIETEIFKRYGLDK